MSSNSSGPAWSGDMLDRPEMVHAFTAQLRRALSEYADYVSRIRRDAEAMWRENPPAEFGSFEAWWRHQRVTGPFAEIQGHLEAASKLTFALEARYRRNFHEIPAARQEAEQAKQRAVTSRQASDAPPLPAPPREAKRIATSRERSFIDLIRQDESA